MTVTEPLYYTYQQNTYCFECASNRFGEDDDGYIVEADEDGNPIGAAFDTPNQAIYCDDCLSLVFYPDNQE